MPAEFEENDSTEQRSADTIMYRFMEPGEEVETMHLVERVFNQFVAPEFVEEGVQEFFRFAHPAAMVARANDGQVVVVAEEGGILLGMIEVRNGSHIALLFVEQRGRGIARQLLLTAVKECLRRHPELTRMTVNSSPYAETIYRKLGFESTGPRQTIIGITHQPMALEFRDLVKGC